MDFIDNMLNGSAGGELQNFIQRYEQGHPEQGYSEQEALNHYQRVAPNLQTNQYIQAAESALDRLTPQQRQEFGQILMRGAQANGISIPGLNPAAPPRHLQNSGILAQTLGMLHQQQPNLLSDLLSGSGHSGSGSLPGNPVAKAALGGIAAMAVKQLMNQRR